jgi:iron(III) transport system permease protein
MTQLAETKTASRPRRSRSGGGKWPTVIAIVVAAFLLLTIVAPVTWALIQTLFPNGQFGFGVYREVFAPESATLAAIKNTFAMVIGGTLISVVMGILLAWVVQRTDVPFARILRVIPKLPVFLPPIVGAVGWVFLLTNSIGFLNVALRKLFDIQADTGPFNINTMAGMIFVTGVYLTPYVFITVSAAFQQYGSAVEEAALVAGCKPFSTFMRITLPLLRPAITSGALLVFVIAMSEFAIPLLLGKPANIPVMTTQIFYKLQTFPRQTGHAAALAVVAITMTLLALFAQRKVLAGESSRFVSQGSRGDAERKVALRGMRWPVFALVALYALFTVAAPILAIRNVALSRFWSADFERSNLTLQNFERVLFEVPSTWPAVLNSLQFSAIAATAGVLVAIGVFIVSQRSRVPGRGAIEYIAMLPISIPATVLAAAMVLFFIYPPLSLYGTNALLVIAYMVHFLPQGLRTMSASFQQLNPVMEEASAVSGVSWWTTFRTVTVPLILPALVSAWMLVFALSNREVSASVLVAPAGTPLLGPTVLDLYGNGAFTDLAAFSVLILIITALTSGAGQNLITVIFRRGVKR